MSLKVHPLGNLIAAEEVKLGRLVRNAREPNQEFYDPFSDRPQHSDIAVSSFGPLQETQAKTRNSKLRSYLSDAVSAFSRKQGSVVTHLNAAKATTHELKNSGKWFKEACNDADTRVWIEETIDEGEDVYLVVGTLVVSQATLSKISEGRTTTGLGAEVALNPVNNSIASVSTVMNFATGVQFTNETAYGHMTVFEAPGDNVVAVRYRKVKHRFFSSKSIDGAVLESGSRWKSDFIMRGEEDDEDEDALEVILGGVDDLGIEEGDEGNLLGSLSTGEHRD